MNVVLGALSWLDAVACVVFAVCVFGATALIEDAKTQRQSLARMMAHRRAAWMTAMVERDVRIMDATLLNIQHQGSAFFASATMIGIGGVAAVIANTDQLLSLAGDIADDPGPRLRAVWEVKLLFLLTVLVVAFLKFVWSHRLFGYCAILIGATPHHDADPKALAIAAEHAAQMNIRAGRSFNRGLRLVYFALAALAWLLGSEAFIAATIGVSLMLYRREFLSETRRALEKL